MHFRNFTICHKLLFLQFENNLGNEEGENEKDRVCRKRKKSADISQRGRKTQRYWKG